VLKNKPACILQKNIVLVVLWLCVTVWIILLIIKRPQLGLKDRKGMDFKLTT